MVSSVAKTVESCLAGLPPERREVISAVREAVRVDGYIGSCERSRLQTKEGQRRAAKKAAKKPGAQTARTSGRPPPMQSP